jgi:sulfatase maturation enzyme AslB (radical SAM superfamily)
MLIRPTLARMSPEQRRSHLDNDRLRTRIRGAQVKMVETHARLSGSAFRCRALAGESNTNVAINADLSVSCNCDDNKGEGRIGSLQDSSFEAVFHGAEARRLRHELAHGKIPMPRCVHCSELQRVPAKDALQHVDEVKRAPSGVMLENNAACNLSCVACYRELRPLERLKMRIEELQRVVTELKSLGVEQLSFFTLGEPFMSRNILEEMQLIRNIHPQVRILTSTNGVLVDSDDKRDAALLMDEIVFSLDGCDQESLVQYQVGSNFDKAYENLCALVRARDAKQARTVIRWKYVTFRWNDRAQQVERALSLATRSGADTLEFYFTKNPLYGVSHRFFYGRHFARVAPVGSGLRRRRPLTERGRIFLAQST